MGTANAIREKCPLIANTPCDRDELKKELSELVIQLNVIDLLSGWSNVLKYTENVPKEPFAFLLLLEPKAKKILVTGFAKNDLENANNQYLALEKTLDPFSGAQAVLVSVESLESLRAAYPSYYLDTDDFIDAVKMAIA